VRFEWDTEKETANVTKHGVDFTEATAAFYDPKAVISADEEHGAMEARLFCIVAPSAGSNRSLYLSRRDLRIIGAGYWRKGRLWLRPKRGRAACERREHLRGSGGQLARLRESAINDFWMRSQSLQHALVRSSLGLGRRGACATLPNGRRLISTSGSFLAFGGH
jgi:uncharacterized DUF497 family protein